MDRRGRSRTSQEHAEIAPKKVVDPALRNSRPGGAGLTATLLASNPKLRVRLLAQAGAELSLLLQQARVLLFPALIDQGRQSTTKLRIYADRGDLTPSFLHRYDLDVPATDFTLPHVGKADLVVVADFQKGIVTEARLKDLAATQSSIPWLVDSKNPSIVRHPFRRSLRERPTLFVNRSEFARIAARIGNAPNHFRSSEFLVGRWHHIEEQVLEAAEVFHDHDEDWDLVVKLDRDGAVAFWTEGSSWQFARAPARVVGDAVGIGAGDAFVAGWANAVLAAKPMIERLAAGVAHAEAWIQTTEKMHHLTVPSDVPMPVLVAPDGGSPQPAAVTTRIVGIRNDRTFDALIGKGVIDLSLAAGHCGRFMTLNPRVGTTVRHFGAELRTFFKSPGARRPLNCLVWAAPGSGKSFLVEEAARER